MVIAIRMVEWAQRMCCLDQELRIYHACGLGRQAWIDVPGEVGEASTGAQARECPQVGRVGGLEQRNESFGVANKLRRLGLECGTHVFCAADRDAIEVDAVVRRRSRRLGRDASAVCGTYGRQRCLSGDHKFSQV